MADAEQTKPPACKIGCKHCITAGQAIPSGPEYLSGWRFSTAAAGAFLLPLAAAIAGAMLAGADRLWQVLGAIAGLIVGGTVAAIVLRRIRPPREEKK